MKMPEFRVLMVYPNSYSGTLVPPALALFSALLKREDIRVELFDTTNYQLENESVNSEKNQMVNLNVRPFETGLQKRPDNVYGNFRKQIEFFGPDLILVTATENMFPLAINLLKYANDLKVPVILGGVFATFAPELCMRRKEIDMLCIGEGEYTLIDLCYRMRNGKDYSDVPGLWVRMKDDNIKRNSLGPLVNMDENPLPDFSIFENSRLYRPMAGEIYRMFPIETHRGCPYACRFCNSPAQNLLYGPITKHVFFRKKSFTEIRKELLYCRDVWEARYFFFWADTFLAWSEKEFDEFCEIYKDIQVPFYCQTRPETITERRIKKLKEAGVHRMGFGIEHGNEEFRREIIGRTHTNKLVINRMKIIDDYDIRYSINNIIGFPDETRDLVFDTIELNRFLASDTMTCSVFMPYSGTKLREIAIAKGYLDSDAICPASGFEDTILKMPSPYLSGDQIKTLRRVFAMYVKFPKERWPEIAEAEALTPEGNMIWEKLRKEFIKTFFAE